MQSFDYVMSVNFRGLFVEDLVRAGAVEKFLAEYYNSLRDFFGISVNDPVPYYFCFGGFTPQKNQLEEQLGVSQLNQYLNPQNKFKSLNPLSSLFLKLLQIRENNDLMVFSAQNPQRIPGQLEFGIGESTRYLSLASVEFGDGQIKIDFDFGPARIFAPMDPGISIAKYCGPADPVAFKKILGKRTIYTP